MSFGSIDEFESFAKNMSNIIIWSDFERVNITHFSSKQRNITIQPKINSGLRHHLRYPNRGAVSLSTHLIPFNEGEVSEVLYWPMEMEH